MVAPEQHHDPDATDPTGPTDPDAGAGDQDRDDDAAELGWWHRDHPTFTPIAAFFTGMVTIVVVPAGYGQVLRWLFERDRVEALFPFVLVIFAIPLGLLVRSHTRRFGRYMLLGMVLSAVVVAAVGGLVLWLLIQNQS